MGSRNYVENDRDDVAILDLIKAIKKSIGDDCCCMNPKSPYDNLTAKLDARQKEKFVEALIKFIEDGELAIESNNQLVASKKWQIHFGNDRFPKGIDEDVDAKQKALDVAKGIVLGGTAKLSKEGNIQENEGVSHKPHKNYGG